MAATTTNIIPCPALSDDDCKAYHVFCFAGTTSITTTVTNNPAKVDEWIDEFVRQTSPTRSHPAIIGFDAQYCRLHDQEIAILQFCVDDQCLIYQICHAPLDFSSHDDPLIDLFADYSHTFVGTGIDKNMEQLYSSWWVAKNPVRLSVGKLVAKAYGRKELKFSRLRQLCEIVLEKEMDTDSKLVENCAWDSLNLTDDQVRYASVRAFVSYQIGLKLAGPGPHRGKLLV